MLETPGEGRHGACVGFLYGFEVDSYHVTERREQAGKKPWVYFTIIAIIAIPGELLLDIHVFSLLNTSHLVSRSVSWNL